MKISKILLFWLCLLATACRPSPDAAGLLTATDTPLPEVAPAAIRTTTPIPSPPATPALSTEAAEYLNAALDIMQNHSINKYKIDWVTFRAQILNFADGAQTPADTYPAIQLALKLLNDRHSFFMGPADASDLETGAGPTPDPPTVELVENRYGYVLIPQFGGFNRDLMNQYGTDMQHQIRTIDSQNPCGWIVDLRGNTGGNMWPMLIGIGPVLGEGLAGSFIDADGNQADWAYLEGKGMLGDEIVSQVNGTPYKIANPEAPVAVLFGEGTASSGEIIVISFIGRPNTRTFGGSSAGYTTGNDEFELSDGAYIFLTTTIDADRNGKLYRSVIVPDIRVDGNNSTSGPIPAEALQWLSEQPVCAGNN